MSTAIEQDRDLSLEIGSSDGSVTVQNTTTDGQEVQNATDVKLGIPIDRKIIYQTVAVALSAMVIYTTFALMQYNWLRSDCRQPQSRSASVKRHKGKKDSGGTSDSSASASRNSCRTKSTSARDAKILRVMCVCASVSTLIRLASEQMELLPADDTRLDCRDYQIAMVLTYCFAITMLYSILWYRVRVFLSHPAMRHLGSKILTKLASVVMVIIIVASGTTAVIFLVTTVSHDAVGGCIVLSPGETLSNTLRFGILTICTVVSQASLLGLFLHPLVRHSVTMRARKISTPAMPVRSEHESVKVARMSLKHPFRSGTLTRALKRGRSSTKRLKKEQALIKIIRRVMITAIICAASDIFCGLIVQLVIDEPRIVTNLVFDVNIVVNLACVLMSFKDWRVRLFPCCLHSRKRFPSDKESTCQPAVSQDRRLQPLGLRAPSSPACFTSRDSTTQGIYHTSDSAINSLSPGEESSKELEKGYSCDGSTSEDIDKEKSV